MNRSHECQNCGSNCGSNSGFIFGLLCGAIIGAIIAIIIYKNNKTEVFEKLSQKIKDFFDNLVKNNPNKSVSIKDNQTKSSPLPKKVLATTTIIPTKQEITPIFVKSKKSAPKMFVKPKR